MWIFQKPEYKILSMNFHNLETVNGLFLQTIVNNCNNELNSRRKYNSVKHIITRRHFNKKWLCIITKCPPIFSFSFTNINVSLLSFYFSSAVTMIYFSIRSLFTFCSRSASIYTSMVINWHQFMRRRYNSFQKNNLRQL